jgi:hypothetical protein
MSTATVNGMAMAMQAVAPVVPRDPASVWSRAELERDRLVAVLEALPGQAGARVQVTRSNAGAHPVQVAYEAWLGSSHITQRIKLVVNIIPMPHHSFPIEYEVHLDDRGRKLQSRFGELTDDVVKQIVVDAMANAKWPRAAGRALRDAPWKIWMPKNRVTGVPRDWPGTSAKLLLGGAIVSAVVLGASAGWHLSEGTASDVVAAITTVFGAALIGAAVWWARKHVKNSLGRLALGILAAVAAVTVVSDLFTVAQAYASGAFEAETGLSGGLVLAFFMSAAGGLALRFAAGRRDVVVYNEGRPAQEPRILHMSDYWNLVVDELGPQADTLRSRFLASVDPPPHPDLQVKQEKLVVTGPDGKEEREQFVLCLRRAMVFVYVYPYASHLYVGWDAHLNLGEWDEYEVARGSRGLGTVVSIRSMYPTAKRVSEYDVHDLNCVIQWAHSRLTKTVKQLAAEHRIDQELDFKIQRADRNRMLEDSRGREGSKKDAPSRVKRTA